MSLAFRAAGGPREVHTLSSLYRVYRAGALRRLAPEPGRPLVREPGFAASVELLLALHEVGATVAEVATVNDCAPAPVPRTCRCARHAARPTAG